MKKEDEGSFKMNNLAVLRRAQHDRCELEGKIVCKLHLLYSELIDGKVHRLIH